MNSSTKIISAVIVSVLVLALAVKSFMKALHPPKPPEAAEISFNFPNIPVGQVWGLYAGLAGKALRVPADAGGKVHVVTPRPLTKTQALRLLDGTLLEQAKISITLTKEGTLLAIPMKSNWGGAALKSNLTTYFPNGTIDPPINSRLSPRMAATPIRIRPPSENVNH